MDVWNVIISGVVSFFLAKYFGDVAGTKAAIKYEVEKAAERRQNILMALHAQVESLPRINTHNKTATNRYDPPKHLLPIPYPVQTFETAIFSESGIVVGSETIQAVTDYLLKARELNTLIEVLHNGHLSFIANGPQPANLYPTQLFIYDQANDDMPKTIQALKKCIDDECEI